MGSKSKSSSFSFQSWATQRLMGFLFATSALLALSRYRPWKSFSSQFVFSFLTPSDFAFSFLLQLLLGLVQALFHLNFHCSILSIIFLFLWLWSEGFCSFYVFVLLLSFNLCFECGCSPAVVCFICYFYLDETSPSVTSWEAVTIGIIIRL